MEIFQAATADAWHEYHERERRAWEAFAASPSNGPRDSAWERYIQEHVMAQTALHAALGPELTAVYRERDHVSRSL